MVVEWSIGPHEDNIDVGSSGFFQSHHGLQDAGAIEAGREVPGVSPKNPQPFLSVRRS